MLGTCIVTTSCPGVLPYSHESSKNSWLQFLHQLVIPVFLSHCHAICCFVYLLSHRHWYLRHLSWTQSYSCIHLPLLSIWTFGFVSLFSDIHVTGLYLFTLMNSLIRVHHKGVDPCMISKGFVWDTVCFLLLFCSESTFLEKLKLALEMVYTCRKGCRLRVWNSFFGVDFFGWQKIMRLVHEHSCNRTVILSLNLDKERILQFCIFGHTYIITVRLVTGHVILKQFSCNNIVWPCSAGSLFNEGPKLFFAKGLHLSHWVV